MYILPQKKFVRNDLLRRHQKRHERGMWFRKSGGILASPTHETPNHRASEEIASEIQLISDANTDSISNISVSHNSPAQGPDSQNLAQIGSSNDANHAMNPSPCAVDCAPEEKVTSLFMDPSFSAPDLALDFDWLFENVPASFTANGDEGLPEVVSSARTSSSGISPPSFPMASQTIQFPVPSDESSLMPWVIARGRLFEALNALPQVLLASPFFLPSNLAYFFDLYFENYHPHFPIIHRPTLDPTITPALLITAIVTLGSTLSRDSRHFETANQIHNSLRYVFFNVSSPNPCPFTALDSSMTWFRPPTLNLDVRKTSYQAMFGSYWELLAGSLVLVLVLIYKRVQDTLTDPNITQPTEAKMKHSKQWIRQLELSWKFELINISPELQSNLEQ